MRTAAVRLGLVIVLQLVCLGLAVAPQLSARVAGDTYSFRVRPVDPIDPFRGAYVQLGYPDLRDAVDVNGRLNRDRADGDVFVPLTENGGVMVGGEAVSERPDSGVYLTCAHRGGQTRCGIESLFLPQDEAAAMEDTLRDGAIARVKIDGRGNAALIEVVSD